VPEPPAAAPKKRPQPASPVAVVDERWHRMLGDAARVAVLLVLGAVLAFLMVLTFF
jgi:hypothetical protein